MMHTMFIIEYVEERSFNSLSLTLYTWTKKGEPPIKAIRNTSKRYNRFALNDKITYILRSKTIF